MSWVLFENSRTPTAPCVDSPPSFSLPCGEKNEWREIKIERAALKKYVGKHAEGHVIHVLIGGGDLGTMRGAETILTDIIVRS